MITFTKDSESKLMEILPSLKFETDIHFAIIFRLSRMSKENQSEYQMKIAINVVNDFFKDVEGNIFVCHDKDIIVTYKGNSKLLLDKIIFQLRYLFIEDKFVFIREGVENPEFSAVFILNYQLQDFLAICNQKVQGRKVVGADEQVYKEDKKQNVLSLAMMASLEKDLENINLSHIIRSQSICAMLQGEKKAKPIFQELYVSMSHLKDYLKTEINLSANKKLFYYFTERLDLSVLKLLRPKLAIQRDINAISLNLNVATILAKDFAEFDIAVKQSSLAVVVEIDVGDAFSDIAAFMAAKAHLQKLGYRVCLDGLNSLSFIQLERETLGFDLAKLQWNSDAATALGTAENTKLIAAIKRCGANRVILTRCDNQDAISYGHALGISLFQGWHMDLLTNATERKFLL